MRHVGAIGQVRQLIPLVSGDVKAVDIQRVAPVKEEVSIDGINGVVVLPRRDKKWGQRPIAFVEMAGDSIDESILMKLLADQLPRIMIPDRIITVASLPLTGSGKYDRQALRNRYRHIFEGGV